LSSSLHGSKLLFPLQQDDMTMDVDITGHASTRQWNLFVTS